MITIYASELAACVGFNRFQPVSEVAKKIFERTDPVTFNKALYRNELKKKRSIENVLYDLDLSERVIKLVRDEDDGYDEKADAREKSAQRMEEIDKIIIEVGDKTDEEFAKDLTSFVFTERGKNSEGPALDRAQEDLGTVINARNTQFFKKYIEYDDEEQQRRKRYQIGGKVDGITEDGKLVEVKNRQYKLLNSVPVYEKIQIHAYMFITGIKECHLVQCFGDKTESKLIEFDDAFWDDVIKRLNVFVQELAKVIKNEENQDGLLMSGTFGRDAT
jgi:hypothetical protein